MRPEDRLRSRVRLYLNAAWPKPPEGFWSSLEHGRKHHGTDLERAIEWNRMKAQGIHTGLPDVICLGWNLLVALELKVGKNTTRIAQDHFASACHANGFSYFVCRSVVEVDEALRRVGLPIPRSMALAAQGHDAALAMPDDKPRRRGRNWDRLPSGDEAAALSRAKLAEMLGEE